MEELIEGTSKIKFVHDTYWTAKCGISPAEQIRRFGKRLLGVHLRDLTLYKTGLKVLSRDAAIGDGVIDFAAVIAEADAAGCEYTVIEQKSATPYADVEKSYKHLLLISKAKE